jgi:CubicO group peptidase (beta-lactamase class C family)
MAMTGGGLRMSGRDVLKLAQLYNGKGVWKGQRVVSEDWVAVSTSPPARVFEKVAADSDFLTPFCGREYHHFVRAGVCFDFNGSALSDAQKGNFLSLGKGRQ